MRFKICTLCFLGRWFYKCLLYPYWFCVCSVSHWERHMNSPSISVNLSVSTFSPICFHSMYFDALLLGISYTEEWCLFLEGWPLYYYVMKFFIPGIMSSSEVYSLWFWKYYKNINTATPTLFDWGIYSVFSLILLLTYICIYFFSFF